MRGYQMGRALARLRNIITALAVVMLGMVIVASPATAADNPFQVGLAAMGGLSAGWPRSAIRLHIFALALA